MHMTSISYPLFASFLLLLLLLLVSYTPVLAVPIDVSLEVKGDLSESVSSVRALSETKSHHNSPVSRNDYSSAGDVKITFFASNGSFFQQTFPVDSNSYVIDNPLKISHLVAEGTGYCAVTGYTGSFTQTQNTCGPLTVSPSSVQVWGQCSVKLPDEGFGLDERFGKMV